MAWRIDFPADVLSYFLAQEWRLVAKSAPFTASASEAECGL